MDRLLRRDLHHSRSRAQMEHPDCPKITMGRYQFFDLECRVIRGSDGLRCYVRVPLGHELYGRELRELNLALDTPFSVSYSAGGAHGWFIGVSRLESWEDAVACAETLARELSTFEVSALWCPPRVRRRSGIRLRAALRPELLVLVDIA